MVKDRLINWKLFWSLFIPTIISCAMVIPYFLEIQQEKVDLRDLELPFALPYFYVISIIQAVVFFGAVIFLGLRFLKILSLPLPWLDTVVNKKPLTINPARYFAFSFFIGLLTGILIFIGDIIFSRVTGFSFLIEVTWWKSILASFYGGIAEEILMRLFFVSFFIWLINKLLGQKGIKGGVAWSAIILAALVFGIAHLSLVGSLMPLTPMVITRTILLNSLGGVIFGYLFLQKGLESAIIAHFSADIMLHAVLLQAF